MEGVEPSPASQVPVDVWKLICNLFTTREWVKSCGSTCKMLHQLQPSHLEVATSQWNMSRLVPGNLVAAVRWTLHHWKDAHSIELTMYPLAKSIPAEATDLLDLTRAEWDEGALQGASAEYAAPAALRVFQGSFVSQLMAHKAMMAKERRGTEGNRPLYITPGPLERFCAQLLTHMERLAALNLFIPCLPPLPAFEELQHLELHSIKFEGIQQALLGLPSLETVLLSCEHLETLLPELHLQDMGRLRHVRLDDVLPLELSLPNGCLLDLKGEASIMDEVIGPAWRDALQHLRSCTCLWTVMRKTGLRVLNVRALPAFLSMAAGCIQELSLHGKGMLDFSVGGHPMQLDPAIFSNLKSLWMKSDMQIQVHVPAAVRLTSLEIYVETLGLHFEDADATCEHLTNLNIVHGPAEGPVGCTQMHEAFAKKGIELQRGCLDGVLTGRQRAAAPGHNCLGLSYVSLPGNSDFAHHLSVFHGAPERCCCMMCWSCMNLGSAPRI